MGEKRNGVSGPLTNLFKARSCEECNSHYSSLEEVCSYHIKALSKRQNLKGAAYTQLLDWLDKIRIGYWIHYKNLGISKNNHINFYINERVAKKDRLLIVYPISETRLGLNLFGADSVIFEYMPSVFGIRINNLLIVSASADFMLSKIMGFPYPRKVEKKGGGYKLSNVTKHGSPNEEALKSFFQFSKPSVYIGQCIDHSTSCENTFHSHLPELSRSSLINFLAKKPTAIELSDDVCFGEIQINESKYTYHLIDELLNFQAYLFENCLLKTSKKVSKVIKIINHQYREHIRSIHRNERIETYLHPDNYLKEVRLTYTPPS